MKRVNLFLLCLFACVSFLYAQEGQPANVMTYNFTPSVHLQEQIAYVEQCRTHYQNHVYVEIDSYACLSKDAMENLATALKAYVENSLYTYNIIVEFWVRLRKDCEVNYSCLELDAIGSMNLHCYSYDFPVGSTSWDAWASWPINPRNSTKIISVCNDDSTCFMANQQAGPPSPFVSVLDVRALSPIGDANNLLPRDVTKYAFCNFGAEPIAYNQNHLTNDISCACMCPAGEKATIDSNGLKVCKKRSAASYFCDTLPDQSYTYELTTEDSTATQCLVTGSTVLVQPTMSLNIADNYVNYYDNEPQGPKLSISANIQTYDFLERKTNAPIILKSMPEIFWKSFARDPLSYLNQLEFTSPGLYTMSFKATDYFDEDTCNFDVFVIDRLPPTNLKTCPGTTNKVLSMHTYTYDKDHVIANADLSNYTDWLNHIMMDKCGSNIECDGNIPVFETQYIGDSFTTDIPKSEISQCFDFRTKDFTNLLAEAERLRWNPEEEIQAQFCKKSCHVDKQTNERSTAYHNPQKLWGETCLVGPSCTYDGTISVDIPENFFTSNIEISDPYVETTTKAIEYLNSTTKTYNSITEIHLINECEDLDETPECRHSVKIQELFTVSRLFKDEWKPILGAAGTPEQFINTRYKFDGGIWTSFDVNSDSYPLYELTRLIHTVNLEVRTPCGVLITSKQYTIYQHPHNALKVCFALEHNGFYQLDPSDQGSLSDGQLCSVPESDFAEFAFGFDHKKADLTSFNEYAGYRGFKSIECLVQHSGETGAGNITATDGAIMVPEQSDMLLGHYALRLLRYPKTAKYTPIVVSCTIQYNGYDTHIHKQVCSKSFSAADCDKPRISIFNKGEPVITSGTCGINCNNKLLPNSVCAGNIIDYVSELGIGKTTFHPSDSPDQECCTDCGSATCMSVFEDSIGIKKCTLDGSIMTSFAALPQHFMKNYGMVAFMSVGLAGASVMLSVGLLTVRYYRTRNVVSSTDGYSPLL